jgi:hydrogenase maturation protease
MPETDELRLDGRSLRRGDRVRLHPRPRGDVFDLALAGQLAQVESIEQTFEGEFHVAVVVDDDPGRSIGPRAPAHRFFFAPEELELLSASDAPRTAPRILVAGIGNIFLGDDGFGVEVIQRLIRREWPAGVHVVDFGIRGYDLAYALMEPYDHVILVDACPRGGTPGSIYVVEPTLEGEADPGTIDAHDMNPMRVLSLARLQGGPSKHVLLVGCEPATLGPEEGQMGLSPTVQEAVGEAADIVDKLIGDLLNAGDTEVVHEGA